jgi:hypothetical protein
MRRFVGDIGAIGLALALALLVTGAAAAQVRIHDDMGGPMGEYMSRFISLRDSGQDVVIDGRCFSACTLVIAMIPRSRICVTQRAALGFHSVHGTRTREGGGANAAVTAALLAMYPPAIRNWINRQGGLREEPVVLQGHELATFYRLCE